MTNEIEELYKLADIEAKEFCDRDSDLCMSCCPEWRNRQNCCKYKSVMPPFTAEKQLELLKLIIREDYGFEVTLENHKLIWISSMLNGSGGHEKLEDAIAGLIYHRWDDIDETEQEEIRKILRG